MLTVGIELPTYGFKLYVASSIIRSTLSVVDLGCILEPLENALEAKIGNFADFKNIILAITISRDDKYRGCYTSVDREFHGGSNDVSCAAL